MGTRYYDYPIGEKKCLDCKFLKWLMVDADEVAPYCEKFKKYIDGEECKDGTEKNN